MTRRLLRQDIKRLRDKRAEIGAKLPVKEKLLEDVTDLNNLWKTGHFHIKGKDNPYLYNHIQRYM